MIWGGFMFNDDTKENGSSNEIERGLVREIEERIKAYRKNQVYLDEHFPTDIPNKVCNHALIQGIKFENSFKPRVHDFVSLMKCDDEELFIWTHTMDSYTALVSRVSNHVKDRGFGRILARLFN